MIFYFLIKAFDHGMCQHESKVVSGREEETSRWSTRMVTRSGEQGVLREGWKREEGGSSGIRDSARQHHHEQQREERGASRQQR